MKDIEGKEYNVDGVWLDHFQWKEPVLNAETGKIDLLTPHADGMLYEFAIDFVFTDATKAVEALTDWDVLEEAVENNWVLIRIHADISMVASNIVFM
jgi:hypothetical protein